MNVLPAFFGAVHRNRTFYALDLNGSSQWLEAPDHNDLSFGDGSTDSPFSGDAWIYVDNWAKFRIMAKVLDTNNREFVFTGDATGNLSISLFDATGSNSLNAFRTVNLSTSTLYHVGFSYDGGGLDTGLKLYVDGALQSVTRSSPGSYTAMHNTTGTVEIGRLGFVPDYANGKILSARLHDKELSAAEFQDLFEQGTHPAVTANTVFALPMEEGTGTNVSDISGNGHDFTTNGSPAWIDSIVV